MSLQSNRYLAHVLQYGQTEVSALESHEILGLKAPPEDLVTLEDAVEQFNLDWRDLLDQRGARSALEPAVLLDRDRANAHLRAAIDLASTATVVLAVADPVRPDGPGGAECAGTESGQSTSASPVSKRAAKNRVSQTEAGTVQSTPAVASAPVLTSIKPGANRAEGPQRATDLPSAQTAATVATEQPLFQQEAQPSTGARGDNYRGLVVTDTGHGAPDSRPPKPPRSKVRGSTSRSDRSAGTPTVQPGNVSPKMQPPSRSIFGIWVSIGAVAAVVFALARAMSHPSQTEEPATNRGVGSQATEPEPGPGVIGVAQEVPKVAAESGARGNSDAAEHVPTSAPAAAQQMPLNHVPPSAGGKSPRKVRIVVDSAPQHEQPATVKSTSNGGNVPGQRRSSGQKGRLRAQGKGNDAQSQDSEPAPPKHFKGMGNALKDL